MHTNVSNLQDEELQSRIAALEAENKRLRKQNYILRGGMDDAIESLCWGFPKRAKKTLCSLLENPPGDDKK